MQITHFKSDEHRVVNIPCVGVVVMMGNAREIFEARPQFTYDLYANNIAGVATFAASSRIASEMSRQYSVMTDLPIGTLSGYSQGDRIDARIRAALDERAKTHNGKSYLFTEEDPSWSVGRMAEIVQSWPDHEVICFDSSTAILPPIRMRAMRWNVLSNLRELARVNNKLIIFTDRIVEDHAAHDAACAKHGQPFMETFLLDMTEFDPLTEDVG